MIAPGPEGSNIAISTFTSSALVVWLIQQAKKSSWIKFVNPGSPQMSRLLSAIGALCAHLGLSYTWNAADHSLLISGLSLVGVLTMLWQWLNHFAMQEMIYQFAANKPPIISATGNK